ncbi:MAG: hypothetical protein WAV51_01485 [Microgenomates group bacterium]
MRKEAGNYQTETAMFNLIRGKRDGSPSRTAHVSENKKRVVVLGDAPVYGMVHHTHPMIIVNTDVHQVHSSLGEPDIIHDLPLAAVSLRQDEIVQISLLPGHRPSRNKVAGVLVENLRIK